MVDIRLDLAGIGDAEVECYRNLKAGQRILLWYSDDNVWHENLVGLIIGGQDVILYTPDHDLYVESVGCRGVNGPVKLRGLGPRLGCPRGLHGRIYRFRETIDDDLIRKVIREAIYHYEAETGASAPIPVKVMDSTGTEVDFHTFYGGRFVPRRLGAARAAPDQTMPTVHSAGPAVPAAVRTVETAPPDYVWLCAEPLGGLSLGQEVSLNLSTDVQVGDQTALAFRQGHWVKIELIRVEDSLGYAERRRRLFTVEDAVAEDGQKTLLDRLGKGAAAESPKANDENEEVRTLWVDYDNQGERFKTWRDAVKESYTPSFDEKPLEGPLTCLHVMKHTERHGGDPRQWLILWMRSKHIEPTDRVYHELKVLTDALFYAGTFDQINAPALISMEVICRRLAAVVDAYTNPAKPSWENAKIFAGHGSAEDLVSPTFRTHATKKNKDELELLQARIKVRELRGSPVVPTTDDVDEASAAPKKSAKGRHKGGGRGGDNA